jgi:hypothetical protein
MVEKKQNIAEGGEAERIDIIYRSAVAQHPRIAEEGEERIRAFIGREIDRIKGLEEDACGDKENRFDISDEIAEKVAAIWVFSGPGTYDLPYKDDRYRDYPWAHGMDRARLDRAAILARKIAQKRSGQSFGGEGLSSVGEQKEKTKALIREFGPKIIYNGTEVENATVEDVLAREGIIIPKGNVEVLKSRIDNTVDQIRTFQVPQGLDIEGKEIALISHAPHLERALHMIGRYQPLPKGAMPRLFPISTPEEGRETYAEMEIRGMLYYIFISPDRDATEEIPPALSRFGNE